MGPTKMLRRRPPMPFQVERLICGRLLAFASVLAGSTATLVRASPPGRTSAGGCVTSARGGATRGTTARRFLPTTLGWGVARPSPHRLVGGACQNTCIYLRRAEPRESRPFLLGELSSLLPEDLSLCFCLPDTELGCSGRAVTDLTGEEGSFEGEMPHASRMAGGAPFALARKETSIASSLFSPLLAKSLLVSHLTGQRLHVSV